ncbi:sensor histidine kinase [Pseudoalteromonas sp. MMG012]|uniref:sensor histidine kinase n=1 Tax=Pseudoalteromonas sp. MMG012 TaxID=2822686 RepID=UPI001B3A2E5C|nr:ATP-binding protein [Pseudoalteromonas sp. MMG012]MBQ4850196.1 GHKL domain-containing protein [Pseudoalteromonas sp. MMG012]
MSDDTHNYKKAYLREKAARDELESLLEDKTRALFNTNQALEEKIDQLQNQQAILMQTEKMATLGTLSAGVAHEINNPLAYATSNLESIRYLTPTLVSLIKLAQQVMAQTVSEQQVKEVLIQLDQEQSFNFVLEDLDELLDDTHEGLQRISAIVNNLLSFARPKNNLMAMADLTESLDGALKLLTNQLKNCKVTCNTDPLPLSYFNLAATNQIFVNLLLNAKYACDLVEGQYAQINVEVSSDTENIYVEVSDNGCGMDENTVNRIFEPFFTTKPVGEGTGMGMAIVYGIVKEHRGEIQVQSKLNEGTRVLCHFPIAEDPQDVLA